MSNTEKELKAQEYSNGFLFRKDGTEVALILKNRPDWQKGKLNGIGGKLNPGEQPILGMMREFTEEAGCGEQDWRRFCTLDFVGGRVHFFVAHSFQALLDTMEDEEVGWYNVTEVLKDPRLIPNLRWLIPMALDKDALVSKVQEQNAYQSTRPASPLAEENKRLREAAEFCYKNYEQCATRDKRYNGHHGPRMAQIQKLLYVDQALADTVAQADPIGEREDG